jgi:hypothetical protein
VTGGAKTDPGGARAGVLGLPEQVTACLFDLDGVRADVVVTDLAQLLEAGKGRVAR